MFRPSDLAVLSTNLVDLTKMALDQQFHKLVHEGWAKFNNPDLIEQTVGSNSTIGKNIVRFKSSLIALYKEEGWSNVAIDECEGSHGFVSIKLYR
jgi:hypothetical protein